MYFRYPFFYIVYCDSALFTYFLSILKSLLKKDLLSICKIECGWMWTMTVFCLLTEFQKKCEFRNKIYDLCSKSQLPWQQFRS